LTKGYQILEKNFKCRRGEVDIVAERGDTIVFVEVKTWRSMPSEALEQAISTKKQSRILAAAQHYLLSHPKAAPLHIRFDVILLREPARGDVEHWQGAFEPKRWHG
jgi:putative endonuclease